MIETMVLFIDDYQSTIKVLTQRVRFTDNTQSVTDSPHGLDVQYIVANVTNARSVTHEQQKCKQEKYNRICTLYY